MALTTLEKVKRAIRVQTDVFDDELTDMIEAAKVDLGIAGVIVPSTLDEIVTRAICTYCKMNFGAPEPNDYDRFKSSYDEQKAQLVTASGYTNWAVNTNV